MAKNITLKIYIPEKTAMDKKVYRVVLPYGKTNLTVIDERAPTSLVIHPGVMQILNEDDSIAEEYFIDGGVVDIANEVCKISTRHLLKKDEINIEKALSLKEQEPHNALFYQTIADYLAAF